MPDPITPTLPDPQASVDAALGSLPPTPVAPAPVMNAPMGDETPLAFAAPTLNAMPTTPTPTPEPLPTQAPAMPVAPVSPIAPEAPKLEPMPSVGSSYLPPVPPAPISTPPVEDKPKKKSKLMLVIIGIFAMLGVLGAGGFYAYKQVVPQSNKVAVVNPKPVAKVKPKDADQASCNGCSKAQDGGWLVWRNGECKVTGICNSTSAAGTAKDTEVPNTETTLNNKGACEGTGLGYVWCSSVDSTGKAYAFCNTKGIGCNQAAVEEGYTIQLGIVKCRCKNTNPTSKVCTEYEADINDPAYQGVTLATITAVNSQCKAQAMGTGSFICREGVKGYSGGQCTADNGSPFNGNLGCFCGTVQVDTGTGHTSYQSTCGCQQNNPETHKSCNTTTKVCETVDGPGADTCATDANCVTAAPVLACTGLTNTPAAPVIGQTVTFTCAGTITPTGAATLSYKFKYSLNDGADQLLANKTNTTAELAITACGTYSVQCKVCATIAGVLKCDPTWTGAIQ